MKYFRFERDLVDVLFNDLNWAHQLGYNYEPFFKATEFGGYFGVPDILLSYCPPSPRCASSFISIAIEAKLWAWRPALIQAFRYKAFAHYSFVAIDQARSSAALKNLDFFKRSGIGLIAVSLSGAVKVIYYPHFSSPYYSALAEKLQNSLSEQKQSLEPIPKLKSQSRQTQVMRHSIWSMSQYHPREQVGPNSSPPPAEAGGTNQI